MIRLPLTFMVGLALIAGCGETQHPVRREKIAPAAQEPGGSSGAQMARPTGAQGTPSLPPGHPPMSEMQGGTPSMPMAGGGFKVEPPEGWVAVQPNVRMIQAEFALPKVEGDENDGRLTVMSAGGTIEDNVQRWRGQFAELEDKPAEVIEVSGTEVTLVDMSGTFNERRGMRGPVTPRPGYRMLAAILSTPDGLLFVKSYGPKNTMAKYAEGFRSFVESLASPDEKR